LAATSPVATKSPNKVDTMTSAVRVNQELRKYIVARVTNTNCSRKFLIVPLLPTPYTKPVSLEMWKTLGVFQGVLPPTIY